MRVGTAARTAAQKIGHRRADQVRQALQNIDPHHPLAAKPEACDPIGVGRNRAVVGERRAAGGGESQQPVRARVGTPAQHPQLRAQGARPRLQQRRHVYIERAEPHAQLAERAARRLVEPAHFVAHPLALQHAERLGDSGAQRARPLRQVGPLAQRDQRPQQLAHMRGEPEIGAVLRGLALLARQRLVGQQQRARRQRRLARDDARHGIAEPAHRPVARKHDRIVDRAHETRGARRHFLGEFFGIVAPLGPARRGGLHSLKAAQMAPVRHDAFGDRRRFRRLRVRRLRRSRLYGHRLIRSRLAERRHDPARLGRNRKRRLGGGRGGRAFRRDRLRRIFLHLGSPAAARRRRPRRKTKISKIARSATSPRLAL